jgi:hypothetical protein
VTQALLAGLATKLNTEGPGAPVVAADSTTLEVPDPEPWEANAAQPENIAPANSTSTRVILRILVSTRALMSGTKRTGQASWTKSQDMYRIVHTIGSSASLVFLQNSLLGRIFNSANIKH